MTGKGVDENGYILFLPEDQLTRQELAQILYAAEGKPTVEYTERFSDLEDGKWYTSAVIWAAEQGVVSGYPDGRFGVNDFITREQLATMLYKYASNEGYDVTARADISGFGDANTASEYAVEKLQWAVANGVMSGDGVNLRPDGYASRAECAAMLRTFMVKFAE